MELIEFNQYTTAKADEVNSNFNTVADAIDNISNQTQSYNDSHIIYYSGNYNQKFNYISNPNGSTPTTDIRDLTIFDYNNTLNIVTSELEMPPINTGDYYDYAGNSTYTNCFMCGGAHNNGNGSSYGGYVGLDFKNITFSNSGTLTCSILHQSGHSTHGWDNPYYTDINISLLSNWPIDGIEREVFRSGTDKGYGQLFISIQNDTVNKKIIMTTRQVAVPTGDSDNYAKVSSNIDFNMDMYNIISKEIFN